MADMTITKIDGSKHDLDIKPADLVRFERKFGLDWDDAKENPKIEHAFYLAWCALRRMSPDREKFPAFDDWLDDVEDVDAEDAGKAAD